MLKYPPTHASPKSSSRSFELPRPCFSSSALASLALDPNRSLNEFGHQAWLTENGLPQNTVQAIVQTQDGYLWIGTQEGLARFDGLNFTVFDKENTPAFKSNDIRALHEDKQGQLWISTSYGLICRHNGQFTSFTVNEGCPTTASGHSRRHKRKHLHRHRRWSGTLRERRFQNLHRRAWFGEQCNSGSLRELTELSWS